MDEGKRGERELTATITGGQEAEAFLQSSLGRSLVQCAEAEMATAIEEIKTVDPTDAKAVTLLQNRIWRAESVQRWIAQIIQEGWNAEAELRQLENND